MTVFAVACQPRSPTVLTQASQHSSTPFAKGSEALYDPDKGNKRGIQDQYLMADLSHTSTVDLRKILEIVFDKTTNWWDSQEIKQRHNRVRNDDTFKSKLERYTDRVNREEDRYQPFCELANHIISLLRSDTNVNDPALIVVRNDRVKVLGSAATRYPDCVAVLPVALEDSRRASAENLAKEGPKNLPFAWQELLFFVEFKMQDTYLGKVLTDEFRKFQLSRSSHQGKL